MLISEDFEEEKVGGERGCEGRLFILGCISDLSADSYFGKPQVLVF